MELKIGPILTVCNRDEYIPNMVDAFLADNERGSHHLNNEAAERLKQEWPTMIEMANLIEKQRNLLLGTLNNVVESTHIPETNESTVLEDARAVISKIKQGQY